MGFDDKESSSETNLRTNSLQEEGMIEDYSKILYKKNLKMNLYNLKDP